MALTCAQPLDAEQLEAWLQDLLSRHGTDILRTKGIVSVHGEDRKLALQAVNMMLEGDSVGQWGAGSRISRLVFIGRNLDRDYLNTGFRNCRQKSAALAG